MVKRTLGTDRKRTHIAIDNSLKPHLETAISNTQCPRYCRFSFTDDLNEIAKHYDGLLTDKHQGILVHNAPLHFTKAVYFNDPPAKEHLRNYSWVGTDLYIGEHEIPRKKKSELYSPPAQLWSYKDTPDQSSSLATMPCRLCEYIHQRKSSVLCMVDRLEKSSKTSETNSYIKDKIKGLGKLEGVIDKLFINHYSRALNRKEYTISLMKKMQTNGVFVDDYDRETLSDELASCLNPSRYLKPGELSLSVKSFYVYYQILKKGYRNAMILEDDAMFHYNGSVETISNLMNFIPPNYSFVQFGRGLNSIFQYNTSNLPKEGKRVIRPNLGDNRHCTTSYIVSKQGAILMFKSLPLIDPIDFQIAGYIPWNPHSGAIKHPDLSSYSVWPAIYEPNPELDASGIRN
ncbi:hypothetical protein HDV04_005168 [Boothiomyces sp. JEL0838]|nr:hypothetical protein HDV04_005168 [Boothiomyces sp. JEL0838]